MAEYYLISQLPSLDGVNDNMPLPVTEERFMDLCERFLGKKALNEMKKLTLSPPKSLEKSSSALVGDWNEGERNLRLALGRVRADKMKKTFEEDTKSFPAELIKAVNTAAEIENPLEAERFLNQYRLNYLESLRPTDNFSDDFVFYYGLKLKLLLRIRQFDAEIGRTAYRNIYSSILNGENLEAK